MSKTYNGLYNDITNEAYHGEKDHISSSNIKNLLTDLEKFHKEKILHDKQPQKENPAFSEGFYA